MQIIIILPGGAVALHVEYNDTTEDLKARIHALTRVHPERIIFAGKQLHDGRNLADCGLQADSLVHAVPRQLGGMHARRALSAHETVRAARIPPIKQTPKPMLLTNTFSSR